MARCMLLGGVLALLAVGAITLAKIPNPAVAQHHAAETVDPAILTGQPANIKGRGGVALSGVRLLTRTDSSLPMSISRMSRGDALVGR